MELHFHTVENPILKEEPIKINLPLSKNLPPSLFHSTQIWTEKCCTVCAGNYVFTEVFDKIKGCIESRIKSNWTSEDHVDVGLLDTAENNVCYIVWMESAL